MATNDITTPVITNGSVPATALAPTTQVKGLPVSSSDPLFGLINSANSNYTTYGSDVNTKETNFNKTTEEIGNLNKEMVNKGADQIAAENAQGIPELNKEILDLQSKADMTKKQYDLTPYSLQGQGRGITTNILRGQEAVKQRELAVENIMTNAELAAKQGKVKYAQSLADRAVDAKYNPIIAKIDAANKVLELNKYSLSRADQKLANERTNLNNLLKESIQNKMSIEKDRVSTLNNQIQAYPDAKITLTDTLESANRKIVQNSKIYRNKVTISGSKGGSGAPKTLEERQSVILSDYNFVPGAKIPGSGEAVVDPNGFITPVAWKAAFDNAVSRGAKPDSFINRFGNKIFIDAKTGTVPSSYGLTPKQAKLITG